MYGCQQVLINPTVDLKAVLEFICEETRKLSDCGVYLSRQLFFKTNKIPSKFDLHREPSFLDNDVLPTFGEKPEGWQASGKRIVRGLYKSAQGFLVNADCNGASNIIRKVAAKLSLVLDGVSRGSLNAPVKIRLWHASSKKPLHRSGLNESQSL